MANLIINEWIKIFKRTGTYVMIGLIVIGIIGMGTIFKIYGDEDQAASGQWKEDVKQEIKTYEEDLQDLPASANGYKQFVKREIAINEYRLEHNIAPMEELTGWTFINDSSMFISFAGLFAIIVAAGIVASEFSTGTIKLLLIRPIKRYKILIAKYATTVLFGFSLLALLFISAAAVGFSLFGTGDGSNVHLAYANGQVVEQSLLLHLIKTFLLAFIDVIMLLTLAFMISAVFRNSSLAIGISIFLLLMGGNITDMLAGKFDWAKYILFANTNLMQYFDGVPLVEGMTLGFSITMLVIYFIVFQVLAYVVFTKRDVAS